MAASLNLSITGTTSDDALSTIEEQARALTAAIPGATGAWLYGTNHDGTPFSINLREDPEVDEEADEDANG